MQIHETEFHPKMPESIRERIRTSAMVIAKETCIPESRCLIVCAALANFTFASGLEIAVSDLNEAMKQAGRGLVRGES